MIYDLTPAMIDRLIEMVEVPTSAVALKSDLTALRATLRSDLLNPPHIQTGTIATGSVTIERESRLTYLSLNTEGSVASDEVDSISAAGFSDFDMMLIRSVSPARELVFNDYTVSGGGNLRLKSSTAKISEQYSYIFLMLLNGEWAEVSRLKGLNDLLEVGTMTFTPSYQYIASAALDTQGRSLVYATSELVGETLATFTIDVNAPGASGTIKVEIDEGDGIFTLFEISYSGGPTEASVCNDIDVAITAGTGVHGYTSAVIGGPLVEVTAPVGSGAAANAYSVTITNTGAAAAVIATAIGGGVDGAPGNDVLSTLSGAQGNQIVTIVNANNNGATIEVDTTDNVEGAPGQQWTLRSGQIMTFITNDDASIYRPMAMPPSGCCQCIDVTLTQTDILSGFTNPFQLIPAPAANEIIVPRNIFVTADYNGTPYATNVTLRFYFPNATNDFTSSSSELNATADVFHEIMFPVFQQNETILYPGDPFMVAVDVGNPTGAGSSFTFHIKYEVITL